MATTAVSTSTTPKMKPPPPPSIHTSNSALPSSSSSSSPSMSAKRPPSVPRQPPNATPNGALANGVQSRSQTRQRKESAKAGQGRSNSKATADGADTLLADLEGMQKQPYVRTSEHILRKFNGYPPSLVLHLHPTYFRFDQQDGSFGYNSPMKVILEHIKAQTIPHDMLEELDQAGVPFYDGCLIVEVHNHKSTPSASRNQANDASNKSTYKDFSIHNYNQHVTPSPYVPYPSPPTDNDPHSSAPNGDSKANGQSKDKADSPVLSKSKSEGQGQAPTFTTVLHPTSLSRYRDLCIEATIPMPEAKSSSKRQQAKEAATPLSAYPQTPLSSIPPTPVAGKGSAPKRQRMRLEESNVHSFEAEILRNTEQALFLEPAESFADARAILLSLTHPLHSQQPPMHKGRKRTVAELAADEAQAAEEERIALVFDERLKPSLKAGGSNAGPSAESHSTSKDFEPNFSRFKTLEDIKRRLVEENARKREEEARRKIAEKEAENRDKAIERQKRVEDEARRQKDLLQRQQDTQRPVQAAAVAQANSASLLRGGNQMPQQMLQNYLQQRNSQVQQGSPMMRSQTPSHSSPLSGNMMNVQTAQSIPMGNNLSNQSQDSPVRPGSAMQMSGLAQPLARQTSQQLSQASQSHQGTPQMPNMTPHMNNGAPTGNMTPQPRLHQGSPSAGPMQGNPMIGMMGGQHVNGQMISQAQQAWMLQQSRQMRAVQHQANAQMHGSPHPMQNQMSPQMLATLQAQQQQQQQQQQQHPQQHSQQQQQLQQHGTPQMNNMQAQMSLLNQQKQQEYRRRLAQEAENKLQANSQQARAQSQAQQNSNMQPTSSGSGFPATTAMAQNMARNASHQQPHMQVTQTPQAQFQQPNQTAQQQTPQQMVPQGHPSLNMDQQALQAQASQHARAQMARNPGRMVDRQFFFNLLASKHGGQLPPNAEQIYQANVQRISLAQQRQFHQQQQQQQLQQMQQGQVATIGRPPQMQQFSFDGAMSPNPPNTGHAMPGGGGVASGQNQGQAQGQQPPNAMSPGSGGVGRGAGGNIDPQLQHYNQLQKQSAIVAAHRKQQAMLRQQQYQQQQQQMMGMQQGQQAQQGGQGRGAGA